MKLKIDNNGKQPGSDRASEKQINQWLGFARRVLETTPVRRRHVPEWFRQALLRVYGSSPRSSSGTAVLDHARHWHPLHGHYWRWLDHWGSTNSYGVPAFVSEPYFLKPQDLADIVDMCQRTGLDYEITGNSWHRPGDTLQVLIFEKTAEAR